LLSLIVHFVLSFIFINLLSLGINGTGYAAFLTFSFRLAMLLFLTLREKDMQDTCIWPDYRIFLGIIDYVKIGAPSTFMICLDWWAWELNLMFSGYFGVTQQAT
jgi:MATE family multidrug resistance protein